MLLAGLYVERTGDDATLLELWPSVEAALRWIDTYGDEEGDGFVEYYRKNEKGLANQGWKDSYDAVFHADGRLAQGPIALAEVQGYVFAAKQVAARCARRLGHDQLASKLEADAARLAEKFEAAFWCPEIETYALALDGAKEPCRVRTSNAGQVLFPDRASRACFAVADGLLSARFFSGWGIRTVARGEVRYNPMFVSQRLDLAARASAKRARLRALGLKRAVTQVTRGLFEAATYMDLRRLPELFCDSSAAPARSDTLSRRCVAAHGQARPPFLAD